MKCPYARSDTNALQHHSNDPGVPVRDGLRRTAANSALGRFSCTDWEVGNSVYFLRTRIKLCPMREDFRRTTTNSALEIALRAPVGKQDLAHGDIAYPTRRDFRSPAASFGRGCRFCSIRVGPSKNGNKFCAGERHCASTWEAGDA